jgi:hypothetical protein
MTRITRITSVMRALHPGLCRYRSKPEMDTKFNALHQSEWVTLCF